MMKKVTCPTCNREIDVDSRRLESGQECECTNCHTQFKQSDDGSGTGATKIEVIPKG